MWINYTSRHSSLHHILNTGTKKYQINRWRDEESRWETEHPGLSLGRWQDKNNYLWIRSPFVQNNNTGDTAESKDNEQDTQKVIKGR